MIFEVAEGSESASAGIRPNPQWSTPADKKNIIGAALRKRLGQGLVPTCTVTAVVSMGRCNT